MKSNQISRERTLNRSVTAHKAIRVGGIVPPLRVNCRWLMNHSSVHCRMQPPLGTRWLSPARGVRLKDVGLPSVQQILFHDLRTAKLARCNAVARAEAQTEMVDVAETAIESDAQYRLMLIARIGQHVPRLGQALLDQIFGKSSIAGRKQLVQIAHRDIE